MDEGSSTTTTAGRPPHRSAWYVAVPAAALVVGLVLGGLLVWVAEDPDVDPASPVTTSETPDVADSTEDSTAVVVPDACLDAADSAREAVDTLEEGVGAIRNFNSERIRELLNRLEDIDARVREQVAACEEVEVTGVPVEEQTAESDAEPSPTS